MALYAGFQTTDITPDFEVELIGGWWPDPKTTAVLHPLRAQALVLQAGGLPCCLCVIDSLGLTVQFSVDLRDRIAARLHTDRTHVMLCFTHTHEAPAPLSPVGGARYLALLNERVEQCAADAFAALRPCKAAWGLGRTRIGENRREGCDALDDRLAALRLTDAETGAPIGLLLRLCAHANILMRGVDGKAVVSSDFIGEARELLAARFGCPVALMQGASGNVKPVGVDKIAGGTPEDVSRVARLLLADAEALAFTDAADERLDMTNRELTYASDVPSAEEAERIARDAQRECGSHPESWLRECERLRREGTSVQRQQGELQFLFVAGGCLCGVPDELFCEPALEAAKREGAPLLLLNGYTNGCTGYLAGAEEWARGGYEVLYSYLDFFPYHGHVTPFRQDTAAQIVDAACEEWRAFNRPAGA
ncbi:MAG: hypothetical protein PHY12_07980 [Eubacteriales bacterium]|nr:hypothetical protein [Eubacteriales bacterium]